MPASFVLYSVSPELQLYNLAKFDGSSFVQFDE